MKLFLRTYIAVLLASISLVATANPCDDGGIGGTGIVLERGIGGTGIAPESGGIGGTGITGAQQGIGGTGDQAQSGIGGTGIVGIITGFGSICVNGLEVHYFSDTPVDLDGKQISSQDLSIGHVVAVKASGNEQSLVAHEIHAYHQITGPITEINVLGKAIKVMGQPVSITTTQLKGLQIGQWVNVSGLRSEDGGVVASRIDRASEQGVAQTVGHLTQLGKQTSLNGTNVIGVAKSRINSNADTQLTGVWDGKSLNVKEIKIGPVSDLLQKVEVFHLQGLASSDMSNRHLKLSGQKVGITSQTKITGSSTVESLVGKSIIMRGHVKDGKPTAQKIDLQPINTEHKNQHDTKPLPTRLKSTGEKKSAMEMVHQKSIEKESQIENLENSTKFKKADKVEKIEKAEKIEKVEKIEKIELPERIEKVEIPERIEKVEIPERIEKIERPEGIEKPD